LKPSQRHRISQFKNKCTLSIQNVQESDSGTIEVIGSNSKGETSCSAELIVDVKPEPKKVTPKAPTSSAPVVTVPLPISMECLDGKSVILKCGFDGQPGKYAKRGLCKIPKGYRESLTLECLFLSLSPEPTVTWEKDGKPLKPTKILQIYKSESHNYVKVSKVFPEDEGVYEATGQNNHGTVTSQCKLVVKSELIHSKIWTESSAVFEKSKLKKINYFFSHFACSSPDAYTAEGYHRRRRGIGRISKLYYRVSIYKSSMASGRRCHSGN